MFSSATNSAELMPAYFELGESWVIYLKRSVSRYFLVLIGGSVVLGLVSHWPAIQEPEFKPLKGNLHNPPTKTTRGIATQLAEVTKGSHLHLDIHLLKPVEKKWASVSRSEIDSLRGKNGQAFPGVKSIPFEIRGN